jgi:pimeloyl-ACP methyl ester carboxylesterase
MRFLLGAFILITTVAQAASPRRTFGPDTTSTGVNTGPPTLQPGLTCSAAGPAPEPLTCTGHLASDLDGTMLDVTAWAPQDTLPHPLAVAIHGWGGSKNSNNKYARQMTDAGFAFLSYSTRGFGDSYGEVNLADVNVEGADLRSMIGQVAEQSELHVDAANVAVFGASYGGAHAFLAALRTSFTSPHGQNIVIRTVAPLATWSELTGALRPNGQGDPIEPAGGFKFSFVEGLYFGGCKDTPVCTNYPNYLKIWNAWITTTEPSNATAIDRQIVDGFSGYRSIYWQSEFWNGAAAARLPIFMAQGWTDDLFPVGETLRMYNALKSIDRNYPIALYLGDVGHPRARNKPEEVEFVIDQLLDWLKWYLKNEGTQPPLDVQAAITGSKDAPFIPEDDVIRVPAYDQLATGRIERSFSDTQLLTFNPASIGGVPWDPFVMLAAEELAFNPNDVPSDFVPGDVAVYEVPVSALASQGLLIAGQPIVTMKIKQLSPTGVREQINVRLFDVKPDATKTLITRGTYTIDGTPRWIGTEKIAVTTYGNVWRAEATDILRLEISNVDSPYIAPSKIPSVTEVSKVTLTIPVR